MTRAMRRMVLILLAMVAFVVCGCDDEYVPHWDRSNGGTCYSTLQRGCVDALPWGE